MTTPDQPGWYDDPGDPSAQRYWDGQDWTPHRQRKTVSSSPARVTPAAGPPPATATPPSTPLPPPPPPLPAIMPTTVTTPPPVMPAHTPTGAAPRNAAGRFWSGLSRDRKVVLAIVGLLVVVAAVAVPITAFHYFFGGPPPSPLTPEQRFVHDVAVAGIVSDDPGVKANVNLPASAETTANIYQMATAICADLNNGTSKADEAMQMYESDLDNSLTSGFHISHDNEVKIVSLAVQDVCPGK
jgi:hypothetical protein